ncbi:hypothetical protein LIA77_06348 [Sarocladium implicatum]|nr:hypothetical protein LIA77_06348 [Sarocladium implicatum]
MPIFDSAMRTSWPTVAAPNDFNMVRSTEHFIPNPDLSNKVPFGPYDGSVDTKQEANVIFDVSHGDIWSASPVDIVPSPFFPSPASSKQSPRHCKAISSALSIAETSSSSISAASTWSSIHTDDDCQTIVPLSTSSRIPSPSMTVTTPSSMICLGPHCSEAFPSEEELENHIRTMHTHTCKWVGCSHPSFASQEGLVWHVEAEHLLVCPCRGCDESGFEDSRLLRNHIAVGHPEVAKNGIKEWQLSKQVTTESAEASQRREEESKTPITQQANQPTEVVGTLSDANAVAKSNPEKDDERLVINEAKRKYRANLQLVAYKRAKKAAGASPVVPQSPESRHPPNRRSFPCRACQKSFSAQGNLTMHYRKFHPQLDPPQPGKALASAVSSPLGIFPTPASMMNTPVALSSHPGYTPSTPGRSIHGAYPTPLSPTQKGVSTFMPTSSPAASAEKAVPFPIVFEHALLPFLKTFLPRWVGPRHIVSVTRGRSPAARRVCITTPIHISRPRKILIAKHLHDLLPDSHRSNISFLFPVGTIDRAFFGNNATSSCWARGLGRDQPDDVCIPRNPFYFPSPCMGDSIGISGTDAFEEATATLGPCIYVGGGHYWLANFHPFVDAYQSAGEPLAVEHPSSQDRAICVAESHDAVASKSSFRLGGVRVTSGMGLQTTRVSHDPYWEEYGADPPLIVTDWALIDSAASHANILRRFPIDYPPSHGSAAAAAPEREAVVRETSAIVPGAAVISSGRTSGYGSGQICEIPAYVSGEENGTQKATREWFIEEAYPFDNEEEWIRGGIGVSGDSGAAVIDAETKCLVGQLWGRNKYWGPGPRHTFFTPIADIFDDIQEKCGQQTRPKLPQSRSEGDCYPVEPPCRTCYDMYRNLDSRRSSRVSMQSMVMGSGDREEGEQDGLTSIEAASELATPRAATERYPNAGLEEIGMTFGTVLWSAPTPSRVSQGISSPGLNDMRSPYAQTLELDDLQEADHGTSDPLRKRASQNAFGESPRAVKRPRFFD